ncbi:MAG: alpha-glucan family phosphorylase [Bacteroidales bacterium]|nr:alpha-glucan family phosphorylase [Bacteroidales bacterium]MCF8456493.1 alpha-glucan family phosphorylase [Bacteroidales bacterium]
MINNIEKPHALFEVSWEVCNKISGIHTVVSTKAKTLVKEYEDNLILIGPDVYRESNDHSEFIEDNKIFSIWRNKATAEGLHVRVGRWNIPGKPLVILVDFTTFFSQKDSIFADLWDSNKLDSISGQWDYIEPVLFGYATGKVIESFSRFHFNLRTAIVAHFHEWNTGAGILYLKNFVPNVATTFTAHSTVLGHALADKGERFYDAIENYKPTEVAQKYKVVSKQSIEKISSNIADSFTTASSLSGIECAHFLEKEVDVITPDGFEDNFLPDENNFQKKRDTARKKLFEVAGALCGQKFSDDTLLILHSGHYEFENKGTDVFIDAIAQVDKSEKQAKDIIAFIMVPANNYGARKELVEKLQNKDSNFDPQDRILSHGLHDQDFDPIMRKVNSLDLKNEKGSKLKVVFVPAFLDGNDGVFNMTYFDLLIGFDLTVFPSYYEPWGYTALESIAFSIPTVTTSLTGIGRWILASENVSNNGIYIVERMNSTNEVVVGQIAAIIASFSTKTESEIKSARNSAFEISRLLRWENMIGKYFDAYRIALKKLDDRQDKIAELKPIEPEQGRIKPKGTDQPVWRKAMVQAIVPKSLSGLTELSKNLWWSWNYEAVDLFEYMDPALWRESRYNPIALLELMSFERFSELETDKNFVENYQEVIGKFRDYMAEPLDEEGKSLAYFSMEYGFHDSVKIFSGGLGILAGDYLKEASDSNVNMIGVGLLYRQGYFKQVITIHGEQIATYERQKFLHLPMQPVLDKEGNGMKISVYLPGRSVYAKIWQLNVGRIKLYLLDTDIDENSEADRAITYQLYGGDNEHRFKQEMIIGVGGIRALNAIGASPDLYHCNEGHAAFIGLERLNNLISKKNFTFAESLEIVRASTLFTTHTPVPAGHDTFNEDLVRTYMSHYPKRLNISWVEFLALGKINVPDRNENFSMSHLALNLSQEVNGVSWLHGEVSKEMFNPMYPGYYPNELHISYVTNGVHYPSWTAKAWQKLYNQHLGDDFIHNQIDLDRWEKIYQVPDEKIWKIRQAQRKILIDYIKHRVEKNWIRRHEDPHKMMGVLKLLNENTLVIGFARRFATYKRAKLLFNNIDRLASIVNNPDKPVLFLFAGKAHPNDKPGQDLIKDIVEISRMPQFLGKILFLENYDIELAKKLVQGVDIWMNTPTRPLEASGTSGMKAVMNGGLHFSVLDGWWVEGYEDKAGWALPMEKTYDDQHLQNQLDAELIYNILEQEVQPLFYNRNSNNIPEKWIGYIKNSIAHVAPKFTMKRMIEDYQAGFYGKLFNRTNELRKNYYQSVQTLAQWKKKVARNWDKIEVVETQFPSMGTGTLELGAKNKIQVVLRLPEMDAKDISLEIVFAELDSNQKVKVSKTQLFKQTHTENSLTFYEIEFQVQKAGITNYGIRMFPTCDCIPHRQDFNFVRWI